MLFIFLLSADCGNKPADIEFVLDSSGSILYKDFRKQLIFTQNLVDIFDVGANKTRIGLVSFRSQSIYIIYAINMAHSFL